VCVTVDGLDSAGCSPKDDEDDDSDDEVSENCAAAAMKQNKISPASGYHSGSAYRYQVGKEKTWLAKFDERQHMAVPSENNSARLEPADDSYCSRYQRRSSEDSTAAGRAFSANSDAVMQRMMRRKQARRERQSAGLTTADSVAGYRGKDCSIEELIEYIDPKPPTGSKTGQRQTGNRRNRKKKSGPRRPDKSGKGDTKTTRSVGNCDVSTSETPSERLAEQTGPTADGSTGTTDEHEIRLSSGDDRVRSEFVSESPLHCDTFFRMLPSEGSSSNTSDGDNTLDFPNDGGLRNYSQFPEAYRETADMSSLGIALDRGHVAENLAIKFDSEQTTLTPVPITQNTVTAFCANVDQCGTALLSSCCIKPSHSDASDKVAAVDSENYGESKTFKPVQKDAAVAENTENPSPSVCAGVTKDAVVDSVSGMHVLQRRHSEELRCITDHREIVYQPSEHVGNCQKLCSPNTGQSTPSSSISDARDSQDFDSQSLLDDMSSDFDLSTQALRESDFTVVTQKKKKKLIRQSVGTGSVDCLRRTFYNRNHRDSLRVNDLQSVYRNELVTRESATVPYSVPVTCSDFSSSSGLCSVAVSQQSSSSLEVPAVGEFVRSLAHDRQTGSVTESVSVVANADHGVTNAVCGRINSASTCGENTSHVFDNPAAVSSHKTKRTVTDVKRSSADCKTHEKVFLDTRRPNVGVAPAAASSELSFWYDVNIPENRPVQADTVTLSSTYNTGHSRVNAEVPSTGTSPAYLADFPTHLVVISSTPSVTHTDDTALYVASCVERDASSQSAVDDNTSLLGNSSRLLRADVHTVTLDDDGSQASQQSLLSHADTSVCRMTLTSGSSSSSGSHHILSSGGHSGNLVIRPAVSSGIVHSSSAVRSTSAADSRWHSVIRSRQPFSLRDVQLFLYNGQLMQCDFP